MSQKINNPNSPFNRLKKFLLSRWSASDIGVTEEQFQPSLLFKDLFIFVGLPLASVVLFKMVEISAATPKKVNRSNSSTSKDNSFKLDASRSQIVDFRKPFGGKNYGSKMTGTLVKVKLLNVVETYGAAPVHVRIMDISLGTDWFGGTLIGEASSDSSINKINISFHLAKNKDQTKSYQMQARALSLNGTLGVEAEKKEGFFARSLIGSSQSIGRVDGGSDNDVKGMLIRALANGLMQEASTSSSVAQNKAQVLRLKAGEVFFVELTDNFPIKN